MGIREPRGPLRSLRFFVRWQLWPILLALPGHVAFVMRGARGRRVGVLRRLRLGTRLARTHLSMVCPHNPLELLQIVEEILSLPDSAHGVIVECGAFLGGSTAKLSLAAAAVRRRLVVCDSFQGLPTVGAVDRVEDKEQFADGDYAGPLAVVQRNVSRFGRPDVVEYLPGWFNESLSRLGETPIACAYLDVDLQSSIEDCLRGLWRQVLPGRKVFVHDVDRLPVVRPFGDAAWWCANVGGSPPTLVGAGSGLGWLKPLLGYAVK